ncbi:DUF1947 domain-containing protein [Candidatus Woesearchaeota archaeon]|nr:DUF1947 domain-containing protein [Candidatus Woesearchaeota archaeon]
MKRVQLRVKDFAGEIAGYNLTLTKKDTLEMVEEGEFKIILLNGIPAFFYYLDQAIPTLKFLQTRDVLKKITVDMGAIKFIVNGADVMRPGIVAVEEHIQKDEPVVIIDEKNKKAIAVGVALLDGAELLALKTGKVVKTIHYVGDALWKIEV